MNVLIEAVFIVTFTCVGTAAWYGGMLLLARWLDKGIADCLRDEPDNPFCGEM